LFLCTPAAGSALQLTRTSITLNPGKNIITEDEWEVMRNSVKAEVASGVIRVALTIAEQLAKEAAEAEREAREAAEKAAKEAAEAKRLQDEADAIAKGIEEADAEAAAEKAAKEAAEAEAAAEEAKKKAEEEELARLIAEDKARQKAEEERRAAEALAEKKAWLETINEEAREAYREVQTIIEKGPVDGIAAIPMAAFCQKQKISTKNLTGKEIYAKIERWWLEKYNKIYNDRAWEDGVIEKWEPEIRQSYAQQFGLPFPKPDFENMGSDAIMGFVAQYGIEDIDRNKMTVNAIAKRLEALYEL
jgi:hypothetical protein